MPKCYIGRQGGSVPPPQANYTPPGALCMCVAYAYIISNYWRFSYTAALAGSAAGAAFAASSSLEARLRLRLRCALHVCLLARWHTKQTQHWPVTRVEEPALTWPAFPPTPCAGKRSTRGTSRRRHGRCAERAHARTERGRGILRFAPAFLARSYA